MASDPQTEALTAILVTPRSRADLRAAEGEASPDVLDSLRAYPCETPEDEATLAEILHSIKDRAKDVEEMRTSITGPLHVAKRAVDAMFKPVKEALEKAETIIKGKLGEAHSRREEANRRALVAAAGLARVGDTASAASALATVDKSKAEGVSYRTTWSCGIVDATMVPRKWLTVDVAAVKEYLAVYNGTEREPEPVPGLVFTKSVSVAAR